MKKFLKFTDNQKKDKLENTIFHLSNCKKNFSMLTSKNNQGMAKWLCPFQVWEEFTLAKYFWGANIKIREEMLKIIHTL